MSHNTAYEKSFEVKEEEEGVDHENQESNYVRDGVNKNDDNDNADKDWFAVVIPPGPVGVQLEEEEEDNDEEGLMMMGGFGRYLTGSSCITSRRRSRQCRVVRFIDGGPHRPGSARKSGQIFPGDWILQAYVTPSSPLQATGGGGATAATTGLTPNIIPTSPKNSITTSSNLSVATTYSEILELLQQQRHVSRTLIVRSFAKSMMMKMTTPTTPTTPSTTPRNTMIADVGGQVPVEQTGTTATTTIPPQWPNPTIETSTVNPEQEQQQGKGQEKEDQDSLNLEFGRNSETTILTDRPLNDDNPIYHTTTTTELTKSSANSRNHEEETKQNVEFHHFLDNNDDETSRGGVATTTIDYLSLSWQVRSLCYEPCQTKKNHIPLYPASASNPATTSTTTEPMLITMPQTSSFPTRRLEGGKLSLMASPTFFSRTTPSLSSREWMSSEPRAIHQIGIYSSSLSTSSRPLTLSKVFSMAQEETTMYNQEKKDSLTPTRQRREPIATTDPDCFDMPSTTEHDHLHRNESCTPQEIDASSIDRTSKGPENRKPSYQHVPLSLQVFLLSCHRPLDASTKTATTTTTTTTPTSRNTLPSPFLIPIPKHTVVPPVITTTKHQNKDKRVEPFLGANCEKRLLIESEPWLVRAVLTFRSSLCHNPSPSTSGSLLKQETEDHRNYECFSERRLNERKPKLPPMMMILGSDMKNSRSGGSNEQLVLPASLMYPKPLSAQPRILDVRSTTEDVDQLNFDERGPVLKFLQRGRALPANTCSQVLSLPVAELGTTDTGKKEEIQEKNQVRLSLLSQPPYSNKEKEEKAASTRSMNMDDLLKKSEKKNTTIFDTAKEKHQLTLTKLRISSPSRQPSGVTHEVQGTESTAEEEGKLQPAEAARADSLKTKISCPLGVINPTPIDFSQFSQEQSIVFEAGPVGMQLEQITSGDTIGGSHLPHHHGDNYAAAKIVRFVDGGPDDPGQARASGRLRPGDFVLRVEAEGVVGTTYYTVLHLLQKSWTIRKLTFRSAWHHPSMELLGSTPQKSFPSLQDASPSSFEVATDRHTTKSPTPVQQAPSMYGAGTGTMRPPPSGHLSHSSRRHPSSLDVVSGTNSPLPYDWTPLPYDWISKRPLPPPEERHQVYRSEVDRLVEDAELRRKMVTENKKKELRDQGGGNGSDSWDFGNVLIGAVAVTAESVVGCFRQKNRDEESSDDDDAYSDSAGHNHIKND